MASAKQKMQKMHAKDAGSAAIKNGVSESVDIANVSPKIDKNWNHIKKSFCVFFFFLFFKMSLKTLSQ